MGMVWCTVLKYSLVIHYCLHHVTVRNADMQWHFTCSGFLVHNVSLMAGPTSSPKHMNYESRTLSVSICHISNHIPWISRMILSTRSHMLQTPWLFYSIHVTIQTDICFEVAFLNPITLWQDYWVGSSSLLKASPTSPERGGVGDAG